MDMPIDFADVGSRIDRLRRYSWKYLTNALEDKAETDLK
jgi:hypothetical protein